MPDAKVNSIALLQAILGGTIQVPTLTGDVVLKVVIFLLDLIMLKNKSSHCSP